MSDALKKLQGEMHHFIDDSRNRLLGGDMPDLKGLDAKVKEFCQMIATLSADEGRLWQQPLKDLQQKMNELGELLVTQREAIIHAIGAVETRKQAHRAYKISSAAPATTKPTADNPTEED